MERLPGRELQLMELELFEPDLFTPGSGGGAGRYVQAIANALKAA